MVVRHDQPSVANRTPRRPEDFRERELRRVAARSRRDGGRGGFEDRWLTGVDHTTGGPGADGAGERRVSLWGRSLREPVPGPMPGGIGAIASDTPRRRAPRPPFGALT
jgi:hypothetical protein